MGMRTNFNDYIEEAPGFTKIHYWDLHPQLCVGFSSINKNIRMRGESVTIKRLLSSLCDNDKERIEKRISFVFLYKTKKLKMKLDLPLFLNNIDFVKLYALMVSEGSFRTEFRLHVPEKIFHDIFSSSIGNLFGSDIKKLISRKIDRGVMRSDAPRAIRYFLPITNHIPKIILKKKDFCRKYLQIAFEAEGSPIYTGSKRYISLKRNVDITDLTKDKIDYNECKRVYLKQLKNDYPEFAEKVVANPPPTLLGEHLILRHCFDIHSSIIPESIRINKTSHRCGKISARWALYIYADSVNRFIKEIDFLTKRKRNITQRMSSVKGNRRQYFALELMKKLQTEGVFNTSAFVKEMKSYGYKSPRGYIWRYMKMGLLERVGYGKYKLLID